MLSLDYRHLLLHFGR